MSGVECVFPARRDRVDPRKRLSPILIVFVMLFASVAAYSFGASDSKTAGEGEGLASGVQATSIISFVATPSRVYVGEEVNASGGRIRIVSETIAVTEFPKGALTSPAE